MMNRSAWTSARLALLAVALALAFAPAALAQRENGTAHQRFIDVESVYYAQPQMIADAVAALSPSPSGHPGYYFLGFAGYAEQDVFLKEVLSTKEVFDERFGTRGRSMVLVNHPATLDAFPLASTHNLSLALKHLGTRLDPEKDVLVLFLSSHGGPDVVSIFYPLFHLNDLYAKGLKAMLDASGIKNRVVVISSCYSGSFITKIADPHTLVLTAAAADRTSFGCSNERAWTFFGDAYVNRALRETHSFLRGFETAKTTISAWEKAEKLQPSLPQIAGGEELKSMLEAMAHRLDEAKSAAE